MKKIIILIVSLLLLTGCNTKPEEDVNKEKYLNLVDTITNHDQSLFNSSSNYFDITYELTKVSEGYRYFITIDKPKNAMYGVEVVACEKGVNYTLNMAANAGIFEDNEYNMLPGQALADKGYVSGITISGLTSIENPTIYLLVQWHSKKQDVHQEFISYKFGEVEE